MPGIQARILCQTAVLALITASLADAGQARAAPAVQNRIVSASGAVTVLERAPASVELFALESDTELFVFAEKQGHVLSRDLVVDLSEPGEYFPEETPDNARTWENLNPGVIRRGTRVSSYYFHFDNKTYNDSFSVRDYLGCKGQYRVSGSITFDRPILGIVMRAGLGRNAHLKQADEQVGLPGVEYDTHYLRHFPGVNIADGCNSDRFVLSNDRRTLTVTNFTDVHHDNYRVILAD
ncbi:hypothetical protein WAB17_13730 [Parerythrobacter aurantius]|uniref:hypothetical protein n=1 Tax=Parerythrobacter aurantius TaxID=3127706 RepID=UPI00324FF74A